MCLYRVHVLQLSEILSTSSFRNQDLFNRNFESKITHKCMNKNNNIYFGVVRTSCSRRQECVPYWACLSRHLTVY